MTQETYLSRKRTLDEAYNELKQLDPNTAFSKYYIRRLAISGAVPTIMCGRKRLIDLDALIEYLNTPHEESDNRNSLSPFISSDAGKKAGALKKSECVPSADTVRGIRRIV